MVLNFYQKNLSKDVLIFDTKNVLYELDNLLISKNILETLVKTHDLIIFSTEKKDDVEINLKKFGIEKYFYKIYNFSEIEVFEVLNQTPNKTIKYFSADVNGIIEANKLDIETIGVISANLDQQTMINNFLHIGAKHILTQKDSIETFLKSRNA